MSTHSARLVELPHFSDARGHLGVVEAAQHLGFSLERAFFTYHTPPSTHRGGHAHKTLQQFLISLGAAVTVKTHNGQTETTHTLQPYTQGLMVPPRHWVDIDHIQASTTLLVLCSAAYDEADYLRDFPSFLQYCAARPGP